MKQALVSPFGFVWLWLRVGFIRAAAIQVFLLVLAGFVAAMGLWMFTGQWLWTRLGIPAAIQVGIAASGCGAIVVGFYPRTAKRVWLVFSSVVGSWAVRRGEGFAVERSVVCVGMVIAALAFLSFYRIEWGRSGGAKCGVVNSVARLAGEGDERERCGLSVEALGTWADQRSLMGMGWHGAVRCVSRPWIGSKVAWVSDHFSATDGAANSWNWMRQAEEKYGTGWCGRVFGAWGAGAGALFGLFLIGIGWWVAVVRVRFRRHRKSGMGRAGYMNVACVSGIDTGPGGICRYLR